MKKILIVLAVSCMVVSCGSDDKGGKSAITGSESKPGEKGSGDTENKDITSIEWLDSTTIDLGTVKEGQLVEARFHFKNTGDKNLVIESVSASCGCTIPERPEEPIPPGGEDIIKAKFDSRGKVGEQHKTVTVVANTAQKIHTLNFRVQVTKG